MKHNNMYIIGVLEREDREQEIENAFEEIMTENLPNPVKEKHTSPGNTESPNKMNPKRPTPRHIIIKILKVKDKKRILKAARENQLVTYRGIPIKLAADFSKETLQARRDWQEYSK